MPRRRRVGLGGFAYHVLNRGAGRQRLFFSDGDYAAFEAVLREGLERISTRLCAYCVMPNHWHLVLWPRADDEMSEFMHWLTVTHAQRWHAYRATAGTGPVYQGRFKSFPIQQDRHFLTVARYVERNALTANLVDRAEAWPWCSLRRRNDVNSSSAMPLSDWPVTPPQNWSRHVNEPQTDAELRAVREASRRGSPFGDETWTNTAAAALGLESTLRPPGRPKKGSGVD